MSTTTAETGVPRKISPQRIWQALLAVSLALNLCFVAGAVWSRKAAREAAAPTRPMAAELSLNTSQGAAFGHYVAAMRARREEMQKQLAPLVGAAWEEIAKPAADTAEVLRLLEAASDKRQQFQREAVEQTRAFLATLSPDQRSKFVAIVREGRPPYRRPHLEDH